MRIRVIFLLLMMILLVSCTSDLSKEEIAKTEINQILDNVADDFRLLEINKLMSKYDDDYYHKSFDKQEQRTIWEDRRAEYNYMEISNLSIEVNGDRAVASFVVKYSNENTQDIFIEPEDIGDISFFKKENNEWVIYGNQQESK